MKDFRLKRSLLTSLTALVAAAVVLGCASSASACNGSKIQTADGCTPPAKVSQKLTGIIKADKQAVKAGAIIARVDIGGTTVVRRGFGDSQTGVPATPAMNFRVGSMTIPALTSVFYQLREEGVLKLTDPVSKWLPNLPRSQDVTLRMLMNSTSGYWDWIQKNPAFQALVTAKPFRAFTDKELLDTAMNRGYVCDPGACFSYAHTNFLILARVLHRIDPDTTVVRQLNTRVLRPLGIKMAFSRVATIPAPTLSAYSTDRGYFEESTGFSPSWGLGNGMLATANIDAVAKLARGVLTGQTLSTGSRKDLVRQYGPDLGPNPSGVYYAQGMIMVNGWRRQNPFFNGYMGNTAWFPKGKIGVSLEGVLGQDTNAGDGVNVTDEILFDIADYLTPANTPSILPRTDGE